MKEKAINLISKFLRCGIFSRYKKDGVARTEDTHGAENSSSAVQQQPTGRELHGESKKWRAVNSSRFLSHRAQLNAYNEAMTRETRKMSRFTGEDRKGNLLVRMEAENVGQGYEPNPLDPASPRFIPQMNAFEMKFDFETLQPIALYPIEKI
ncbi:hypothetical protein [Pseudomonas lini]|uniref:hypothetical protein n=1 Tax=Pseudomonas lini TaxID=163011 RepID=UPI00345EB4C0